MSRAGSAAVLALAVCASPARAEPSLLSEAAAMRAREIRAINPDLRDDAFSKMGGSSVASKAFLHCFATPHVDLGEHADLGETLDYFHAGPASSFDRNSKAAGVSWNLKYVLGGRPANFRKELAETRARWALILFGANDAQNENERVYLQRLVHLVESLADMGVVPILGSAPPRRHTSKDRWIRRFNTITEAVARHWSLPFIDYHAALSALPRKGLASDGVHPNVLAPGGLRAACQLTEKGLHYGNNVRNLLTLQTLDALRRLVAEGSSVAVPAAGSAVGAGTDAAPSSGDPGAGTVAVAVPVPAPVSLTIADLPFSALVRKASLPAALPLPAGCGPPGSGPPEYRVRIELDDAARLRVSALDLDGEKPRVYWARVEEDGSARCVRRRTQTLEMEALPGGWDLIVQAPLRADADGRMLIVIAREPR
jgi:hypothetical protein